MDEKNKPGPGEGVHSYGAGIRARNAERKEEKQARGPVFPALGEAAVDYNPAHGLKTIAQMGEEQRATARGAKPAGLSQETVAGMQALKEAQERVAQPTAAPVLPPAAVADEPMEDMDLAALLAAIKADVMNNEKERAAIEARLSPIDISKGILTGTFTQEVPIIPDVLVVTYQCLSGVDNQKLQAKVYKELRDNPDLEPLSGQLLGLYQTVATIIQINGTKYPSHLRREGYKTIFDEEIFERRYHELLAFPLPMISSLGIHSSWFDQRVRKCFTSAEALKNG